MTQARSLVLRGLVIGVLVHCAAPSEQAQSGKLLPARPPASLGNADDPDGTPRETTTSPLPGNVVAAARPVVSEEPPPSTPALRRDAPISVEMLPTLGGPNADKVRAADRLLGRNDIDAALKLVAEVHSAPAELLEARALVRLGQFDAAEDALTRAAKDTALADFVALEHGQVALARADARGAVEALLPLVSGADKSVATRAALPLATALSAVDPAALLANAEAIERALPTTDPDARSNFLEALATAQTTLSHADVARELRLKRFLEEPVSLATPESPPDGAKPKPLDLLARAEKLLEANRNEKAIVAFNEIADKSLGPALRCRKRFGLGLASRNLHHYAAAEGFFTQVIAECASDESLVRRAMYLNTKVVSIADGLRAVPLIEEFAKKFPGHSFVDDVLFWAGDLYHRRKMWPQAEAYFKRIDSMPEKGDQCADARWRLAWMSFRRGDLKTAEQRMTRLLERDGCVTLKFDRARAHYWLGRIAEEQKDATHAVNRFASAFQAEPLGYYSQLALKRVRALEPERAEALVATLTLPKGGEAPPLCPGVLTEMPAFVRALELLLRGLGSDAASELLSIEMPMQKVVGATQATALGVEPRPATPLDAKSEVAKAKSCGAHDAQLLLALLLDRAGVYGAAHWRLRTDFAAVLADEPTPATAAIWIAAYPLAYRELVAAAEEESHVPPLLLQALCREESALDPSAVSWAGAYGLTQLLVSSAKGSGKLLSRPVEVKSGEDLLDPALSARLGAALLGSLVKRYKGNAGLALAGYNASEANADTWWTRYQGEPFDVFEEEITIKETRGYVARVLKTWGTYRWMYAGELPELPVDERLPEK